MCVRERMRDCECVYVRVLIVSERESRVCVMMNKNDEPKKTNSDISFMIDLNLFRAEKFLWKRKV